MDESEDVQHESPPQHAGNPHHPDHGEFLRELGRATFAAAHLAGICFNVIRVLDRVPSDEMYSDALGDLEVRLRALQKRQPDLPGLAELLTVLPSARQTRNDLLHALPVRDGLHRRKTQDLHFVRNFYSVADLENAANEIEAARKVGNRVLHGDGGAAVRAWADAELQVHVTIEADGRVEKGDGE